MVLVVSLFLALCGMVISYALGQGGPVAGLVFLTILFVGAMVRITEPLRARLRP